jgi:hypothetical protein
MSRFTAVVIGLGFVAGACDGPTRPSPSPADTPSPLPASPPASSSLQALAGSYDLKVTLSDTCTELAQTVRHRTYRATLEETPYAYLTLRVTGGGYFVPTVTGDVWPNGPGGVVIVWNNFDFGGCDGFPERLPDGSPLMICGAGPGIPDDTGRISVALSGRVLMGDGPQGREVCAGTHQFTFTKQ